MYHPKHPSPMSDHNCKGNRHNRHSLRLFPSLTSWPADELASQIVGQVTSQPIIELAMDMPTHRYVDQPPRHLVDQYKTKKLAGQLTNWPVNKLVIRRFGQMAVGQLKSHLLFRHQVFFSYSATTFVSSSRHSHFTWLTDFGHFSFRLMGSLLSFFER